MGLGSNQLLKGHFHRAGTCGPHTGVTLGQDTRCKHELEVLSCWSWDTQGSKGMSDVAPARAAQPGQGVHSSQDDAVGAVKLPWGWFVQQAPLCPCSCFWGLPTKPGSKRQVPLLPTTLPRAEAVLSPAQGLTPALSQAGHWNQSHTFPSKRWRRNVTNGHHAADLRVCGCVRSSTFSLKSLGLQISHIFQVTGTVFKGGGGREEREEGGGDLDLALSAGELSGLVLMGLSPWPGAAGQRWPEPAPQMVEERMPKAKTLSLTGKPGKHRPWLNQKSSRRFGCPPSRQHSHTVTPLSCQEQGGGASTHPLREFTPRAPRSPQTRLHPACRTGQGGSERCWCPYPREAVASRVFFSYFSPRPVQSRAKVERGQQQRGTKPGQGTAPDVSPNMQQKERRQRRLKAVVAAGRGSALRGHRGAGWCPGVGAGTSLRSAALPVGCGRNIH